jgi:hypothetical protein
VRWGDAASIEDMVDRGRKIRHSLIAFTHPSAKQGDTAPRVMTGPGPVTRVFPSCYTAKS